MKKQKLLIALVLLSSITWGQTDIKKTNISVAGGSVSSGTTAVRYTVGETTINESTQSNLHLSEGFIGVDIIQTLGIENFTPLDNIITYPNPVKDFLYIDLPVESQYQFYIYDLNGKEIYYNKSTTKTYRINFVGLRLATYVLIIIDKNHQKKSIQKIQKL